MFKIFYCNYGMDETIEGPNYIELNSLAASKVARLVLAAEDDFYGVMNHEDKIIQFMVENDGSILIDVPISKGDNVLCYQRKTVLKEVEDIILNLPESFKELEILLNLSLQ